MSQLIKILIVEANSNVTELLMRELYRAGFDPHWLQVETETDYLANLSPDLDLILSDYDMQQFSSRRALELLQQRALQVPFILVTDAKHVEIAVKMVQVGVADYVLKEQIAEFGQIVHHAMKEFGQRNGHEQPART